MPWWGSLEVKKNWRGESRTRLKVRMMIMRILTLSLIPMLVKTAKKKHGPSRSINGVNE